MSLSPDSHCRSRLFWPLATQLAVLCPSLDLRSLEGKVWGSVPPVVISPYTPLLGSRLSSSPALRRPHLSTGSTSQGLAFLRSHPQYAV